MDNCLKAERGEFNNRKKVKVKYNKKDKLC